MSFTGVRTIWPCCVSSMISSLSMTVSAPTTRPVFSLVFIVMMPLPPRDWVRYSSNNVRLPMPFSPATSSVAFVSTTAKRDDDVFLVQRDAAHAGGGPAHGAHVRFLEADAHALAGDENRLARAAGQTTSIRLSPCSMPMAMMPPLRQLAKSSSDGLLHRALVAWRRERSCPISR